MATAEEYATFAGRLIEDGVLVAPWFEGAPRFGVEPLVITRPRLEALGAAAEAVTAVYDELCGLCAAEPRHLTEFFGLTPFQQLMWAASAPQWHGFARADLFEVVRREGHLRVERIHALPHRIGLQADKGLLYRTIPEDINCGNTGYPEI